MVIVTPDRLCFRDSPRTPSRAPRTRMLTACAWAGPAETLPLDVDMWPGAAPHCPVLWSRACPLHNRTGRGQLRVCATVSPTRGSVPKTVATLGGPAQESASPTALTQCRSLGFLPLSPLGPPFPPLPPSLHRPPRGITRPTGAEPVGNWKRPDTIAPPGEAPVPLGPAGQTERGRQGLGGLLRMGLPAGPRSPGNPGAVRRGC